MNHGCLLSDWPWRDCCTQTSPAEVRLASILGAVGKHTSDSITQRGPTQRHPRQARLQQDCKARVRAIDKLPRSVALAQRYCLLQWQSGGCSRRRYTRSRLEVRWVSVRRDRESSYLLDGRWVGWNTMRRRCHSLVDDYCMHPYSVHLTKLSTPYGVLDGGDEIVRQRTCLGNTFVRP